MISEQLSCGMGDHLVHFYRDDGELAERVGAYLTEGLDAGGVAIAIATERHRLAIEQQLAALGVDRRDAIVGRRLILLDARATLGKLVIDGRVDRGAFDREVGETVRAACRRHSVVRAYGEMVDLLWQDGDIPGAIELETVWNDLMTGVRFKLLCAYHSEAAAVPGGDDALRAVCQLHSSQETSRTFQPDLGAPAAARRFVERVLRGWGRYGAVIDDARLLVSELVTNAVVHTRSAFSVSIAAEPRKIRLGVHDVSTAVPPMDGRAVEVPSGGRGLRIVAAVADDWGVVTTPPGKTVWAELSATALTG